MILRTLSSFAVVSALALPAQDDPVAAERQGPALPGAKSPEATRLLEQALAKMQAYGRGTFRTSQSTDHAMTRQAGIPVNAGDIDLDGGWHRELLWGEWDGREYICGNGRMLAKIDGDWRLRRNKLGGGLPVPFTLDPGLLFTVLQRLPAAARTVVNVEGGKLRGSAVVVLSLELAGEDALELSDSGAVPDVSGGLGGVVMFGGWGGFEPPRPDLTTYLAFSIDAATGDLLRFGARVYEKNPMFGNVQIAVGAAGGQVVAVAEEEHEEAVEGGPMQWWRGFPRRKPGNDESVMTYQVDFAALGLAEPPQLSGEQKALLQPR